MTLPESIADALMLKMVATGQLTRKDIIETVQEITEPKPLAITDAPLFWPRPWVSKEAERVE